MKHVNYTVTAKFYVTNKNMEGNRNVGSEINQKDVPLVSFVNMTELQ